MEGITILSEHLCRVVELRQLIGTGILITLICVGGLFIYKWMYEYSNKDKQTKTLYFACSTVLLIANILFWIAQIYNYNTTHMEYTVTVDDNVSFNDFYERYEIVSIDGSAYRVVEK